MEIDYLEWAKIQSSITFDTSDDYIEKERVIRNLIIGGKEHILLTNNGISIYKLEYDIEAQKYYIIPSLPQKK